MLIDRYAPYSLFAAVPQLALRFEPELARLDGLLDDEPLFRLVRDDLVRRYPRTLDRGRPSTPVEVVLRLLVVQHLYGWSYAEVVRFVADSLVLRQFCRLGLEPVPHPTTLLRWANLLQPETLHRLLDRATELARSLKVTRGRKLRVDSTVVATAIHYPTDSSLLADGVRVLGRLVDRARALLAGRVGLGGRRRARAAKRLARRIQATAALHAPAAERAERPTLYRRLLELARASLERGVRVEGRLAGSAGDAARRLRAALAHVRPLVEQVVRQAERRVVHGETVPAAEKLVSIFEPHTAVLRRGKAHLPAEFGRKVVLDEVDGGLVTRFAVLPGNPSDAPELPRSLAHHRARFGRAPAQLAADRGFHSAANEQFARDQRIRSVALPRQGPLTPRQRQAEQRPAFRRVWRWRAGIEGRISLLKRRFGLARCRYHGTNGLERWIGLGVLAHNLRQISRTACAPRAA